MRVPADQIDAAPDRRPVRAGFGGRRGGRRPSPPPGWTVRSPRGSSAFGRRLQPRDGLTILVDESSTHRPVFLFVDELDDQHVQSSPQRQAEDAVLVFLERAALVVGMNRLAVQINLDLVVAPQLEREVGDIGVGGDVGDGGVTDN